MAFSLVNAVSCLSTITLGLMLLTVSVADSTFERSTSSVPWAICRCRFEKSTTSKSTRPIRPMPAAARYMLIGEPSPPVPMHSTLALLSFFWPAMPTSGRMRWRE